MKGERRKENKEEKEKMEEAICGRRGGRMCRGRGKEGRRRWKTAKTSHAGSGTQAKTKRSLSTALLPKSKWLRWCALGHEGALSIKSVQISHNTNIKKAKNAKTAKRQNGKTKKIKTKAKKAKKAEEQRAKSKSRGRQTDMDVQTVEEKSPRNPVHRRAIDKC